MPDASVPDSIQLQAWLEAAAHQDASAFRALYDATSARLYGFALRILSRPELAEEALQDGFVAIWHHAGSYQRQLAAPMTWMTAIIRNKAIDLLRVAGADEIRMTGADSEFMDALRDPGVAPGDALALSREARALADCVAALESAHRQAIGLAFFHDLSHSEVAHQMALPIGTVKTWIRRSLERLKTCLQKGGWP